MANKVLEQELKTFAANQKYLEEHHFGKFVLIHGTKVINTFDTFENAAQEALRCFRDDEEFMIREIGKNEIEVPPALRYGLMNA